MIFIFILFALTLSMHRFVFDEVTKLNNFNKLSAFSVSDVSEIEVVIPNRVVGIEFVGAGWVFSCLAAHLMRCHLLVEKYFIRRVFILDAWWHMRDQILIVHKSVMLWYFLLDKFGQGLVGKPGASEIIDLNGNESPRHGNVKSINAS